MDGKFLPLLLIRVYSHRHRRSLIQKGIKYVCTFVDNYLFCVTNIFSINLNRCQMFCYFNADHNYILSFSRMARLYLHYDNIALTYPPNMDTSYSHSSIFSDAELKSSLNMTYPWVRTGVDGCNAVHKTTG